MSNRQLNITYHGLFLACVLTPVSGAFSLVAAAAAAGYQEIMTDPSYKGQFVVFTHPHIGNVGINDGELKHRNVVIMSTPYGTCCYAQHMQNQVQSIGSPCCSNKSKLMRSEAPSYPPVQASKLLQSLKLPCRVFTQNALRSTPFPSFHSPNR
jgi:hypothetical protein